MFKAPSTSDNAARELREVPVESIVPNRSQPRRRFDEEALKELAGCIGERGVLQPVLVRPSKTGCISWSLGSDAGVQPRLRAFRRSRRWCPTTTISRRSRLD